MVLKLVAFVLSLGIDTLVVAVALGSRRSTGVARTALAFSVAEAAMPVVGLAIGHAAGGLVGRWASLAGGLALCVLAAWMVFFEDENDDADRADRGRARGPAAPGEAPAAWALAAAAISVSLDELAAGFSIGLIGLPVVVTVALIALQSFVFTLVGMRFGTRLRPYLGERAERGAGVVLGLLGLWILLEAAVALGA